MRRVTVIAACALGACGFDLRLGDNSGSDAGDRDAAIDGTQIDTPPALVPCATPSETGLLACFELEDGVTDGVLHDSSAAGRDATATGLLPADRDKPAASKAATAMPSVSAYVPDAPELDRVSGYTVTMWINPDSVPSPQTVFGIYDHEDQYAGVVARTSTGGRAQLRCINTNGEYEFTTQLPTASWSFAACTWDGYNLCAQFWSSPTLHERYCTIPVSGIATLGDHGLALGHLSNNGAPESRFHGSFDSIQLYDHALTATELCAIIGEPATCLPCDGVSCPN